MSEQARRHWSQKKCPFGVGDDSGKCCTSDCAAWKEWDTRETVTDSEERWEDSKPPWFSGWSVEQVEGSARHCVTEVEYSEGKHVSFVVPDNRRYLWVKKTSRKIGNTGGGCGRL
jgi:hypothetical protein